MTEGHPHASLSQRACESSRLVAYPQWLVTTDSKIQQVEKQILQALISIKQKQLGSREKHKQVENANKQYEVEEVHGEAIDWGEIWHKEDEIDMKNIQYVNKCSVYYENKLHEEQLRSIQARNQYIERIANQDQEITLLKEQLEYLQKEVDHANNKIKKLELENEHVQNYRKNQKERITQLLIQEKQDIFNKYNQIEKENMAVLEFAHRMEDMIQKKGFDDRDQDVNKISYIKQIQLEASKLYSTLGNPIIQETLNAFTQVVNALHRKLDRVDRKEDIKSSKTEKYNKNSTRMPLLRLKSSQGRDASTNEFQILHLKQELAKSSAAYEQKLKQVENLFEFEKEKSASLKKKIEKYETELEKRNREMEIYQHKQVDTSKKIQWLEQSLLDCERKLKMQNEQINIFEEKRLSSPAISNESQPMNTREKSKSVFLDKNRLTKEIKFETSELHCQLTRKSEEIEELKGKIKNINKTLMAKQESFLKSEKKLEETEAKLKEKKELLSGKQHQIQRLQAQIAEKDEKIERLFNDVEKGKAEVEVKAEKIASCEAEISSKIEHLIGVAQNLSRILNHIPNSNNEGETTNEEEIGCLSVQSQTQIQQINSSLAALENELKSAFVRAQKAELQASSYQKVADSVSEQLKKYQIEMKEKQKQGDQAKEIIRKLTEDVRAFKTESELMRAEAEKSSSILEQHQKLASLNQALLISVKQCESKLAVKHQELEQLKKENANLKQDSEAALLNFTQRIKKQKQEVEERNRQLSAESKKLAEILATRDKEQGVLTQQAQTFKKRLSQTMQQKKVILKNLEMSEEQGKAKDNQIKALKEQKVELQAKLIQAIDKMTQQNEQKAIVLEEMRERMEEKLNGRDNSIDNEQNLNQSNELNVMQTQINNFKQQLHSLLEAIQQKDCLIHDLKQEMELMRGHEPTPKVEAGANLNQQIADEEVKQRMAKTILEQQKQLEKLKIQETKHQMLIAKVAQLEKTLDKEKQMYQNEQIKNSKKIYQLEDEIRCLKQEVSAKKRKVFSEEYFSLQPHSNKFSSRDKTSGNAETLKAKETKGEKRESREEISSEVFHSLEEDFVEEAQNRKREEEQLDNQKATHCRLRREKSQGYDRKTPGERYYDSDQKLRQQKDIKIVQIPVKGNQELSALGHQELKNMEQMGHKQKQGLKPGQGNLASHEQIPQVANSENSTLNQIIRNLSEENKQLKSINQMLKKDFRQITEFMEIFDKTWKSEKAMENCSESGKLMSTQKLLQNVRVLEISKIKLLEEFNSNDLQSMFDSITKLIAQTKRWVDLIERLTNLNKKLSLQAAMLKKFPKLIKTRTLGLGESDSRQRSRSVYSEGNVYRQHHIDVDESPFEMNDEHHQHAGQQNLNAVAPPNSLEILFKQNVEMSEISSVKHRSHNSGFLNSKSEIAKMFEKGEKHENAKELRKEENKKDIVDEYLTLHQKGEKVEKFDKNKMANLHLYQSAGNNKIHQSRVQTNLLQNSPLMHKNSSNYYQEASNLQSLYNQRYELKSNKAKRRIVTKTATKLAAINSKISQHKKEYAIIIKNIIQKYEEKIAHLQTQFSTTLKKIMQISVALDSQKKDKEVPEVPKSAAKPSNDPLPSRSLSNRISEKDEQVEEKIEELQIKIEKQRKQLEAKDKSISEMKDQLKEAERKLKQQRQTQENLKSKYLNQVSHSSYLNSRIEKISLDFKRFVQKIMQSPVNTKKQPRSYNQIGVQVQIQAQDFFSPTNLENQKRFLKSKKILGKLEALNSNDLTKETSTSLTNSQQIKVGRVKIGDYDRNEKAVMAIEVPLIQEAQPKTEDRKGQKLNQPNEQAKQKKIERPKQEVKQREQVELGLSRIKSQAPQNVRKKEEELRQSDRSEGEMGKSLTIGAILNNIMNPNSNTLTKKKTISEASKPDQVIYYQCHLKDINKQVKQLLFQHFKEAKIESQKLVELQDEIFKSKKERETKTKITDLDNDKDREKEKEKEKQADKRTKDEEQIKSNIQVLEAEIVNFKKQASRSVGERQDRLKLIIKKIVEAFKISKKSVDKVINDIEKKEGNSAKFIDARLFFKNVYTEIKSREPEAKEEKEMQFKLTKQSSIDQEMGNDAQLSEQCYEFESYEEKYRALEKLNQRLKADLQAKSQQCMLLRHDGPAHLEAKKNNSRQHSFVSNENSEQFEDFENKELFDNTKPTFELVEDLKMELEYYKKKCEEFEVSASRKKNEKVKYIRKW